MTQPSSAPQTEFSTRPAAPTVRRRYVAGIPTWGVDYNRRYYPIGNNPADAQAFAELLAEPTQLTPGSGGLSFAGCQAAPPDPTEDGTAIAHAIRIAVRNAVWLLEDYLSSKGIPVGLDGWYIVDIPPSDANLWPHATDSLGYLDILGLIEHGDPSQIRIRTELL